MVNGSLSRILYLGALALVAICLVGKMVLAGIGKETGSDVTTVLMSLIAFLFGTHVTPLLAPKQIATTLEKTLKQSPGVQDAVVTVIPDEQTNG